MGQFGAYFSFRCKWIKTWQVIEQMKRLQTMLVRPDPPLSKFPLPPRTNMSQPPIRQSFEALVKDLGEGDYCPSNYMDLNFVFCSQLSQNKSRRLRLDVYFISGIISKYPILEFQIWAIDSEQRIDSSHLFLTWRELCHLMVLVGRGDIPSPRPSSSPNHVPETPVFSQLHNQLHNACLIANCRG